MNSEAAKTMQLYFVISVCRRNIVRPKPKEPYPSCRKRSTDWKVCFSLMYTVCPYILPAVADKLVRSPRCKATFAQPQHLCDPAIGIY